MKTRNTDAAWLLIATMLVALGMFFAHDAWSMPRWHPCQMLIGNKCYCRSGPIVELINFKGNRVRLMAEYLQGCDRRRIKRPFADYYNEAYSLLQMHVRTPEPFRNMK